MSHVRATPTEKTADTWLRTPAGRAWAAADVDPERLRQLLDDPESLLWRHLDRPVKLSHTSVMVVAEVPTASGGSIRVAYKQFRPRSAWKAFCGLFRPSRARVSWRRAQRLLERGIATPPPVLWCAPRKDRLRGLSYLATQWIEGAENLHLFGWRLATLTMTRRLREASAVATVVGRLVGQMHAAGIANRDLKAANVLVVKDQQDGQWSAYLVDPDGTRARLLVGRRRRVRDLARLSLGLTAHPWVSKAICARMLKAYAEQFARQTQTAQEQVAQELVSQETVCWKTLWRQVVRCRRRMIRRRHRWSKEVF